MSMDDSRLTLLRTGPAPTLGHLPDGTFGHLSTCPCRACEAAREATESPTVFDDAPRVPRYEVRRAADVIGENVASMGYGMRESVAGCGCDEHQDAEHFETLRGAQP